MAIAAVTSATENKRQIGLLLVESNLPVSAIAFIQVSSRYSIVAFQTGATGFANREIRARFRDPWVCKVLSGADSVDSSTELALGEPPTLIIHLNLIAIIALWRRERDSNPRYPFRYNGFQDRRIKPLCHPSADREPALPH